MAVKPPNTEPTEYGWARVTRQLNSIWLRLFADAEVLRRAALTPDGQVRDPMLFEQSIKLKLDLMNDHMRLKPKQNELPGLGKGKKTD